jgi:hypothetical protein
MRTGLALVQLLLATSPLMAQSEDGVDVYPD